MIEVEVKLKIKDRLQLVSKLHSFDFAKQSVVEETDQYYDNAISQIRSDGQALRIRSVRDLQKDQVDSVVTFKGKKLDQISMTRRELETGIEEPQVMHALFGELGFYQVPPAVKKRRTTYTRGHMTACVDEVEGLGTFLELEIVVPEKDSAAGERSGKEDALSEISDLLQKLGYSMEMTTRNSYLSMLQGKKDE